MLALCMEAPVRSLTDRFVTEAGLVGAQVVTADRASIREVLRPLIDLDPPLGVALTSEVRELLPDLADLERPGSDWPGVTIGLAMFGIAQTGSVVLAEAIHRDRLMALLCIRHIVLLPAGSMVPDTGEAVHILGSWLAQGAARYVTFVSGPSRTSDIERVLTVGAHGPRELVVVLVEEWDPRAA